MTNSLKEVCVNKYDLLRYLETKGGEHKQYKMYTTMDKLKGWIEKDSFYLSYGDKWNDVKDKETFNKDTYKTANFATCFSYSRSENVAMWMLYGGTRHNGVMLNLSPKYIARICSQATKAEVGYWDNGTFYPVLHIEKPNFDLKIRDIIYYGDSTEGEDYYYIKRSDEVYKKASKNVIDQLEGAAKSIPWRYENECRLILSVERAYLNSLDKSYLSHKDKAVRLQLGGFYSELKKEKRIFTAPNFSGESDYSSSKMSDQIDWDLCYRCSQGNGETTK